jgi:hypothetical protein
MTFRQRHTIYGDKTRLIRIYPTELLLIFVLHIGMGCANSCYGRQSNANALQDGLELRRGCPRSIPTRCTLQRTLGRSF